MEEENEMENVGEVRVVWTNRGGVTSSSCGAEATLKQQIILPTTQHQKDRKKCIKKTGNIDTILHQRGCSA
ncbi:hypothetical protein AAG906_002055 [Vitis piasezkii]